MNDVRKERRRQDRQRYIMRLTACSGLFAVCSALSPARAHDVTAVLSDRPYQSNQGVVTSGAVVIESGHCAAYSAGTQVDLKPGFWAKPGSSFHAVIAPVLAVTTGPLSGTVGTALSQQLAAAGQAMSGPARGCLPDSVSRRAGC